MYWRWRAAAARLVILRAARIASLKASGSCSASSSASRMHTQRLAQVLSVVRSALGVRSCWEAAGCRQHLRVRCGTTVTGGSLLRSALAVPGR